VNPRALAALLAPGLLVAATGVGAGDLISASLAGANVGPVVVWAALLGAVLKWTVNEGTIRWQLATGSSLLEGWWQRLGPVMGWAFLLYFLAWSLAVANALITACGVAATALFPLGDDDSSRRVWGIVHALGGYALVQAGGFVLFRRVMTVVLIAMVVAVLLTAGLLVADDPSAVLGALFRPALPQGAAEWRWTLAVLGGVGGTVTMLSYGYWVREAGRSGVEGLRSCRKDLAVSYALTALFGAAMVLIGTRIPAEGAGARVAVELAAELGDRLGPAAGLLFRVGFWAAVFSSLLGVWQSAPYLFADTLRARRARARRSVQAGIATAPTVDATSAAALRSSRAYQGYLVAIALLPLALPTGTVQQVQLTYALLGAWFVPAVALTLLVMNTRSAWIGAAWRSGWRVNSILVATVALFTYLALVGIRD
jgi:Mn2+/Fe2+ NRAMP family transporter